MPRMKANPQRPLFDITNTAGAVNEIQNQQQTPALSSPGPVAKFKEVSKIAEAPQKKLDEQIDFFTTRSAINKLRTKSNEMLFGTTEGAEGYMLKKGENSFGSKVEYQKRFDDISVKMSNDLFTPSQRLAFTKQKDSVFNHAWNQLDGHESREMSQWKKDGYNSTIILDIQDLGKVATDPVEVRNGMTKLHEDVELYHKWMGSPASVMVQEKRKYSSQAAEVVLDKNIALLPPAKDIKTADMINDSMIGLETLLDLFEGEESPPEGSEGELTGLNVYLSPGKQDEYLKKIRELKRSYQQRGLTLNSLETPVPGSELSPLEMIDEGMSLSEAYDKGVKYIDSEALYSDEDREDPVIKNREEDIKETSRPEVMKELKKRRSLNKKIRTDNKTNMLQSLTEAITDKNLSVESVISQYDKSIKTKDHKPYIPYTVIEAFRDYENENDAGFPLHSDSNIVADLLIAIAQRENMDVIANNFYIATQIDPRTGKRKLSKNDMIRIARVGFGASRSIKRAEEVAARREARGGRREKSYYKREFDTLAKAFPFLTINKTVNEDQTMEIVNIIVKRDFPDKSPAEVRKMPEFPQIVKDATKTIAIQTFDREVERLTGDGSIEIKDLKELSYKNAPGVGRVYKNANLVSSEKLIDWYIKDMVLKGKSITSFVKDTNKVSPEVAELRRKYNKGELTKIQAVTELWRIHFTKRRQAYKDAGN